MHESESTELVPSTPGATAAEGIYVPPQFSPAPVGAPRWGRAFAFTGGAATYLGTAILSVVITVFTLGFCYPLSGEHEAPRGRDGFDAVGAACLRYVAACRTKRRERRPAWLG